MKRSGRQAQIWLELAATVVAGAAIAWSSHGVLGYNVTLEFLAAVFVLNLMDLRMPYGDVMPVDMPLLVAALMLVSPSTAAVSAVLARSAVHVARNGLERLPELLDVVSRRLVVIVACGLAAGALHAAQADLLVSSITISVLFAALDLALAQAQAVWRLEERFFQLLVGNLTLQAPLLTAQVSLAALTVITFENMRFWALILMLLLVFLMRQSLALLLDIRMAYRATIEALVASIEIQDRSRRGHAERVERIAREIGLRIGLRGKALEALGYAALLHDVDLIGVDPEDAATAKTDGGHAADIVAGVGFLSRVVPILRLCDGGEHADEGPGEVVMAAMIVATASDFDDAQSGRAGSHHSATALLKGRIDETTGATVLEAAAALGYAPATAS